MHMERGEMYIKLAQRAALSVSDSKNVCPEMSFVVQITMSLDSALASHRSADISVNVMPPMKKTIVTLGLSAAAPARAAAAAGMA